MNFTKIASTVALLIVGLGLAVNGYSQSFLTNGLIAYYPFNGNANDASGNGNDGIVYGASLTADRFGHAYNAYYFNGTNSYIRIPQSSSLNNLQTTTISYWTKIYKPTSGDSDVSQTICNGNDAAPPPGFGAYATRDTLQHRLGQWNVVDASVIIPFDATVPLAQQSYACITFVATWTNLMVYRNGVLRGSAYRPGVGISRPAYDWFIGTSGVFGASVEYYLNGMMDDIRIYNRALSESEVQQLYAYESAFWVTLIKAVKPSFSNLIPTTNYQLQVSAGLYNWTNYGAAFTATNTSMVYPQYFEVDNWNSLFFRLQASP